MAEQRTPGSESTSPAQERGTAQEVSTHISATARHMGETASHSDVQGRPQLEGWEQALEASLRAKPLTKALGREESRTRVGASTYA